MEQGLNAASEPTSIASRVSGWFDWYRQSKKWIKTSPWAWFGLIVFGLFILYILKHFLEGKEDQWKDLYNPTYSPISTSQTSLSPSEPKESKGEKTAREAATRLFGKPFIKIRPDLLRNQVTSHNLEIDIYNDELKLGIEYSGRQHYEYVPFFHKNREAFLNQKYRDEIKRMLCKQHGITLIEIPYTVKIEEIESFLRTECTKRGLPIPTQ